MTPKYIKNDDPKQYDASHRTHDIYDSYENLIMHLGEPFRNHLPDFPDDSDRVDVCWMFESSDKTKKLAIWNYKNGPAYSGEPLNEIYDWSVYCNNEDFFREFKKGVLGMTEEK